ncbi:RNA-binding protein 42 [Folsomia candida]|uniref:RNA-binding protein 42 n=1 Tax=Folsomia candida TaxID=158441 RepID=A0A226F4Z5_FOLCA|nr:RNA-binding protein 42 [Folsomia candida]OXA64885.1 RNA-binding protein 42 [Folsomia candida]
MGDPYNHQKKMIESEMDRFEQEISSLAPTTMARSFIPAQLRRPMGHGHSNPMPPGTGSSHHHHNIPPPPPSQLVVKPSPVIISGAPQVYNANAKPLPPSGVKSQETIAATPQLGNKEQAASSSSSVGVISKAPSLPGSSSSSAAAAGPSVVKVLENPKPSMISSAMDGEKKKPKKKKKKDDKDRKPKKALRSAGGQVWEDLTLQDWDPNGFRLFCGDLGNDVTDEVLTRVFGRYPSFQKAKVVRDKRSNKTKGFGFVSFKDPNDFVRAIKELDGRYVGSRPIKLRKSNWKNRNIEEARKKEKERNQLLSNIRK